MSFKITKNDSSRLRAIARQMPDTLDQALRGLVTEMTTDVILSFGTSPPGAAYKRGNVTHVASLPGYPPNVDIGTLRAAVRWIPDGRFRYLIVDGVYYGIYLELGTDGMAARPFMSPVFEDWRPKFVRWFKDWGLLK